MTRTAHVRIEAGPLVACEVPDDLGIHQGDQCIIEVDEIEEFGRVEQLAEGPPHRTEEDPAARVLRMATLQDQARHGENAIRSKMALDTVAARAAESGLQLRVVRGHYSFDHNRLRVLFSSEAAVDVRDLVRDLSGELRAHIDMRQVGVRDEAAIIGGLGPCGRCLCCCSWLKEFDSVNVKMAKTQKLSLNPGAISGNCGRLKCCLRYEFEQYRELGRGLPRHGMDVETPDGVGRVLITHILRRRVKVRMEDGRTIEYDADDVRLPSVRPESRREPHEDTGAERTEPGSPREAGAGAVRPEDA